jgi:hypothetical protein
MKKGGVFLLFVITGFCLLFPSCDLFEDTPTADMAVAVTWKLLDHLDHLHAVNYSQYSTVGSVINSSMNETGELAQYLKFTVLESGAGNGGGWYSGTADMYKFSGDGSRPYIDFSGTVTYTDKTFLDGIKTLKGTLDLTNVADKSNTIDTITYDLKINASTNRANGTVTADGVVLRFADQLITY